MINSINEQDIVFNSTLMSANVRTRFAYLAESMHGILNGEIALSPDVIIIAVEDGIVASRQRAHTEWKPQLNRAEFVDIRIGLDGAYQGYVKGPLRANRVIGDRLAPKTIFEHLISMCAEVGIGVSLPDGHKVQPKN